MWWPTAKRAAKNYVRQRITDNDGSSTIEQFRIKYDRPNKVGYEIFLNGIGNSDVRKLHPRKKSDIYVPKNESQIIRYLVDSKRF